MDTTIDRVVAEIKASISASGVSAEKIIRRLVAAAKKAKTKTISNQAQAESAGPGVYRVKGATGLYLKKGEAGSASWFYRFRFGGKRPEMGLGALAGVTLAEARAKVDELKLQIRAGVNPITARRTAKAAAATEAKAAELAASKWVFTQATDEYLRAHASSWKHRDAVRIWHNPVVKYAYPVIGRMLLDDIRVEHVNAAMDAAVEGGAPKVAPRIRLRIEQIINLGIVMGHRDAARGNPASVKLVKAVRPTRNKGESEHFRRIPLDDAPAVFRELKELAEASTRFSAWKWTIATAARPGEEALKARWDEIDLAKKLWVVPKERTKTGKEHVVPLSSIALSVLERQAQVRVSDWIFPGRGGGVVGYTVFSRAPAKARIDAGSPHSWRSIFRDWGEEKGGVAPQTLEAALPHSLGAVESAYRRETAVPARAVAMQRYADWLEGKDAKVVPFKGTA